MIDNVRDDLERRADTVRNELDALLWLVRTTAILTVGAALYQELSKPADERTWHGKVLGVVPYDFRPPDLDTFRRAYWDPKSDRIFTDRPLGVGWGINLPALLRRLGLRQA